ncbi:MAG: DUF4199 domain-containing protein [Bacteroidales bacterium]|jgi:hypothetical protein|nr:DUF4199 domain-containing protein [Bacteroidales bacterium]
MEQNTNVWKANLTNGLIIGLASIVYSLVMYFLDLTLNKTQGYIFLIILIVVLFYLLKSYRDNFLHGQITYGQSLGAGMVIFLYYSIIAAVFAYILYKFIDPGLVDKQLAMSEEMMVKRGAPQTAIDAGMAVQRKIMKPEIMAPFSILSTMFFGLIISLIVSIFVRKEGNPLVDNTAN